MEKKKPNIPQINAGRKWAARLKELNRRSPPQGLMDKINRNDQKKVAVPRTSLSWDSEL